MFLVRWTRVLVLIVMWTVVAFMLKPSLRCVGTGDAAVQARLKGVFIQLEALRQQHSNLIARIRRSGRFKNLKDFDEALFLDSEGPMEEYENLRRRIYSNTKELWYYVNHELTRVMNGEHKPDKIQAVLDQVADRKRSLLSDQDKLVDMDGYQDWRRMEAANVSDLVQRRLHYLQNPPDCKEARKLVCDIDLNCGFGCQLHHLVYYMIFAYATERTLILNSRGWQYSARGWENLFHPLSETCSTTYGEAPFQWPVFYEAKVITVHYMESWDSTNILKPGFLPLAIPKDLAHRIARFNGDPASWWIAQMVKFILKPRANVQKTINDTIAKLDFMSPIVGIHVRRTDKVGLREAHFHHIYEYMNHVKDYYYQLEMTQTVDVKRVYVATDDASVLDEVRKIYPETTFLSDKSIADGASKHRRYSSQSLVGLLVDIEVLSRCDFIVCTLSSQIGRTAYELKQTRADASKRLISLDDTYYLRNRIAVISNAGTNQNIAFNMDDQIDFAFNHWNGYGFGVNKRTNTEGLFPWYKTAYYLKTFPFPEYKKVLLNKALCNLSNIQPNSKV